jgi:hypothetical protein
MAAQNLSHDFAATLLIATFMVGLTVIIHFCGLAILMRLLRRNPKASAPETQHVLLRMLTILFVVFGLFAVHTIEIWSYAMLYHFVLDAVPDIETAVYYSTVSFVSLGYGDVVLPDPIWLVDGVSRDSHRQTSSP